MIKKQRLVPVLLLALCGLLCFVLAACAEKEPEAASIALSEEFEDGRVFEYAPTIELPYGIALDKDGNGISYDVENIVTDREGNEIARSDYSTFALSVGDYIVRYEYGSVVLEKQFSVHDTVAPVIVFGQTTSGGLFGEDGSVGDLPIYEVEELSAFDTEVQLNFQPDDGALIEDYPYNAMVETYEADRPGTFTYTVTATDASGNTGSSSVSWRAKNRDWQPESAPSGTFLSDFNEESYVDSLWNGDFSDTYEANGNFYGTWLENYQGANGVLKVEAGFNSYNSVSIRFKFAKSLNLGENEHSGKYLVVRMYLDDADAIGSMIYVAGNTRSDHTWDGGQTIRENEVLTRSVTEADGIVSGEWFNIYIPVSLLIEMQCASNIQFDEEAGFNGSSSYPILNNSNRGNMEFFQIGFSRMESVDRVSLYIDSIAFADELDQVSGFAADYAAKTVSWQAVANAAAYAVYDEFGARIAITEKPEFDASELGAFSAISVQPLGCGAYKDPEPVVVTPEDLNLFIEEDGSWIEANFFKPVSAAYEESSLAVTLNSPLGTGTADFSAFKLYAGEMELANTEIAVDTSGTRLIFDVSAWPKTAGAYEIPVVTVPARSTIAVGNETYTLIEEIRFAYVFGEWRYITETEIGDVGTKDGFASSQDMILEFFDTEGEQIFGKTANEQYTFYADPAARTLDYSGSFTFCGQEIYDLLREFNAYGLRLFGRTTDAHYIIIFQDNQNWQWVDRAAICERTGYDAFVATIAAGTRMYFKTDSGEVDCFYFPDGYTFTKNGIGSEPSDMGYTTEKGEPQSIGTRYTVKYMVEGDEYAHNTVFSGNIALRPVDPIKQPTAEYTYTFSGWYNGDAEWDFTAPVTADVALTAKFTQTARAYYTITFKNDDGTILDSMQVAEGEMPAYTGETPVKTGESGYVYEFDGWSEEIVAAAADAEYTATYITKYVIRFENWDGSLIQEFTLEAGADITPPTATRLSDSQYSYMFDGWDPAVPGTVSAPGTYKATYISVPNEYKVIFKNEDSGGTIDEISVAYGGKVDLSQLDLALPETGGVLFFVNGEPWDSEKPVTANIEVTVRIISVETLQAEVTLGGTLDLDETFCGGLAGTVWSLFATQYAAISGSVLTPEHAGIVTLQGQVGTAAAFTVTVYIKDTAAQTFEEHIIVDIGATAGSDPNFIIRFADSDGVLVNSTTATYEFTQDKFWYEGSIKFCGMELFSLVGADAQYKDIRLVYTPSGFRIDVQSQDGTWQTSLTPSDPKAKLQPINGFHNVIVEFAEGTQLYVKLAGDNVLAMDFAYDFCYEWNTGVYAVHDITGIAGKEGDSNFYIKISDVSGEITHPATFDNAYLGSGFSYTGSIKVCGIELRDLSSALPARFSPDASGRFARFIYVAGNGYRLDLYDAGREAGASFWGAWEPFNGYSAATVEFGAGTVLYIKNGANSKTLRFGTAMYLQKGGEGNIFTEYEITSVPAYAGTQWGQYNLSFATDEGLIPVYKNNTTVRTYEFGSLFTYEGSITVGGIELSELIGQHGVTGIRLAGYTDVYALQVQGSSGWAYISTLLDTTATKDVVFTEGTVLFIRAGEDSKMLRFMHTFTIEEQNSAAVVS